MRRLAFPLMSLGLVVPISVVEAGVVVTRADVVYDKSPALCPGLIAAANGDLILTFTNVGDVLPGCETFFLRSSDGGETWTQPYLVMKSDNEHGGLSVWPALRLDNGDLLFVGVEILSPTGLANRSSTVRVYRSADNGQTLDPDPVTLDTDTQLLTAPYGPMVQSPNGDLLLSAYVELSRNPAKWGCGFFRSRDGGRSWGKLEIAFKDPPHGAAAQLGFNETAYVVRRDGSLLAVARNDRTKVFYWTESFDNGRTWAAPRSTSLIGGAPALRCLPNGDLLLAYRDGARPGLTVALSNDNGRHWRYALTLLDPKGVHPLKGLHWDPPKEGEHWRPGEGYVGYPAFAALPDGKLYVAYHVHSNELDFGEGRDPFYIAGNVLRAFDGGRQTHEVFTAAQIGGLLLADKLLGPQCVSLVSREQGLGYQIRCQRLDKRSASQRGECKPADQLFYILAGKATVRFGGTPTEGRGRRRDRGAETPGGEQVYSVGPGDLLSIPRNTPWRWEDVGEFLEFLAIEIESDKGRK